MRRQHFRAGDVIFAEGDPSAYAYVLEEGRVEIFREAADGKYVLGCIGPDEIFGEMGLVDERPRSASARVLEDAVVSAVTGDEFAQLLFDSPAEGLRYIKALFERLRTMNDRAVFVQGTMSTAPFAAPEAAVPGSHDAVTIATGVSAAAMPAAGTPAAAAARVVIYGATSRAKDSLADGHRAVDRWPFRVGRAAAGILGDNHLELKDNQPYSVSRNHFLIDRSGTSIIVRDRGSFLGTIVNGEKLGGRRGVGEAALRPGSNTVIAGDRASPFRFRVQVPE